MKVSDAQRFAIAKGAAQFGTTAVIRLFATEYPDRFCSLKEPKLEGGKRSIRPHTVMLTMIHKRKRNLKNFI